MRWLFVLLLVLCVSTPVFAQDTDTPTPTPTSTPTDTPTPTETYTPTPNYYVESTTPAGEPARIAREISIANVWVILLLFAILVSMWVMYIAEQLKGKR